MMKKKDGLLCLACLLFPAKRASGERAKTLITQVDSSWKDATDELKRHAVCSYHKASAELMRNFAITMDNKASRVDLMLDKKAKEQLERNREALRSILRCLEFCGSQWIAIRGHRDDDTSTDADTSLGNLKSLLSLCCQSGDHVLKQHLETWAKDAKYTSKTAQNDLLLCIKGINSRENN